MKYFASPRWRGVRRNYELYLFCLLAIAYIVLFRYAPMYGVQIAFKDYRVGQTFSESQWVGLKHLTRFLSTPSSWMLIRNTLTLSVLWLLVGFPIPILFSLIINELRPGRFKKTVQTLSYAPHFISVVVLISVVTMFLHESSGVINKLGELIGLAPVDYMSKAGYFPGIYVISGLWQDLGWNSVIYISALAGVDPELHEAAMIDGASRLKRIWHINLPGILPTVTILLILAVGNVMTVGFEKVYLMQNAFNTERSEIISTFVYKIGILYSQYSYSTAIGLFNSVINFILLVSVNSVAKRISDTSLW